MSTERCRHCGYGIPTDATSCPGCARAHVPTGAGAPPHPAPRHRSPLLRLARWTRRAFVLTAWTALVAGMAALAAFVVGRERIAEDLSATTLERTADVAHTLVVALLVLCAVSLAALAAWAARARHNLAALGVRREVGTPWALSGWLVPGEAARQGRFAVDARWRDRSPALAPAPGPGWTRRPISIVVLHWWAPWAGAPALLALAAAAIGGPEALVGDRGLVAVAGAALAVASLRALYDVVGVVTFAQADRAEHLLLLRATYEQEAEPAGAPPGGTGPAPAGRPAGLLSEPLRG